MQRLLDGTVLVDWAQAPAAEPLVRSLVATMTGTDPGPVFHACPRCGSVEHGRPYVDAPVDISVAHAAGLTVVAVSTAGPVGVDTERAEDSQPGWVRREAVAKALGTGLVDESSPEPQWRADLEIPGYVAAVALVSRRASAAPAAPAGGASGRTGRRGRAR
jgi:phosphopantetheinyl transferase